MTTLDGMKNEIYNELEKKCLPLLSSFSSDLTKHDKNTLDKYNGEFIHITRSTGTALIKLKKYKCIEDRESYEYLLNYFLEEVNYLKIIYFDGKKLKEINKEKAFQIFSNYNKADIEDIIIEITEKTSCNKTINYLVETNTKSFKEAQKEFSKFYSEGKTIKAVSTNGIIFFKSKEN